MDQFSCNAQQLYRNGGLYEHPAFAARLLAGTAPGVRTLGEVFPAFSYERPLPDCIEASDKFRGRLLEYYAAVNARRQHGASSLLVELSNAVVTQNVLYLQQAQGRSIVHESYRRPDRPWSPLLAPDAATEKFPVERKTLYFFLGSVGSFNYGHWLLDDFARLRALRMLRAAYPRHGVVILLPRYSQGMEPTLSRQWNDLRAAALARLLGNRHRQRTCFIEVSRAYCFDRLFYATPITFHPVLKSPGALAWTARQFGGWRRKLGFRPGPRRVLVMRRVTRGRVVENMESLRTLLEQRGFTTIDPETLSVAGQSAAFADADTVVGVMGAAMSNTVFCRPGTRVIHLAPEGWREPFYWDLAAVRGHRYAACYGPATSAGPVHLSPFRLPESSLLRALRLPQ